MADDVLHAAVVEQDALVLEAGVAAHCKRSIVHARGAAAFVPFWAALLMPLSVAPRAENSCPNRFGRVLWLPLAPLKPFNNRNARR